MKYAKLIFLLMVLLFALSAIGTGISAEDQLLTKAFVVKFREVDEVASLVKPLLSDQGAVTLQPRLHTVIVQDFDRNLRQIESAIASFDVPPPSAEIAIKLVRATKETDPLPVTEEVKNMARIGDVLRFNQYKLLDTGSIQCQEGQSTELSLAKDYRISFVPDVIQEGNGVIRLKNFQLKRHVNDQRSKDPFVNLISVTVNLRNGETLVLGASRFEDSDQALLVILLGKVKK